LPIPVG